MSNKVYLYTKQSDRFENFECFFNFEKKIRNILVASAYYDIPSINELYKILSSKGYKTGSLELIIIIDAYASGFLSNNEVNKKLLKLNQKIKRKFKSDKSGIYIAITNPLFHSKGYLLESDTEYKWLYVGSANLTQNGINKNEEIMLEVNSKSAIKEFKTYIYDLIDRNNVFRVDAYNEKPKILEIGMRNFFMSGHIYYENKEQSPFRFNLKLPENIKTHTSNISILLESKTSSFIDISKLITNKDIGLNIDIQINSKNNSMWKNYCIETCYGFWSPDHYSKEINSELEKKRSNKEPYYNKLIDILKNQPDDVLNVLISVLSDINKNIIELNGNEEWIFCDINEIKNAWDKWHKRFFEKIKNDIFKFRIISGVSSVIMPDIWNDPLSVDVFEESFFESVAYYNEKTNQTTRNWPAFKIYENYSYKDDFDWKKLQKHLEIKLKKGSNIFD